MAIGNILWPFGIFCGHLVYFPRFGMLYLEKSGNPGFNACQPTQKFGIFLKKGIVYIFSTEKKIIFRNAS
jgi:hypothetical protein